MERISGQSAKQHTDMDAWFSGDRRLFSIDGPFGACRAGGENPGRIQLGDRVELPRTVRDTLALQAHWQFFVTELRYTSRGPIGFCEIRSQPGRGVWVRLGYLSRSVPLVQGPPPKMACGPLVPLLGEPR